MVSFVVGGNVQFTWDEKTLLVVSGRRESQKVTD